MLGFRTFFEACHRNKRGCAYWGDSGSGILPLCSATGNFAASHRGQGVNEGGEFGLFGGGILLDEFGLENPEDLFHTDIPKRHAKHELRQETGYDKQIKLIEVYLYHDDKMGPKGLPCDFYYWNYVGIVPEEFKIRPEKRSAWEEGGQSGWMTFQELMAIQPKHFGLQSLLQNAGHKIQQLAVQYSY